MLTKVQRWGNSQGLRVTKTLLDEVGIRVGDEVEVSAGRGRIIVDTLVGLGEQGMASGVAEGSDIDE